MDREFIVLWAGIGWSFIESVADYFLIDSYAEMEVFGTTLDPTMLMFQAAAGMVVSAALAVYVYRFMDESDKNSFLITGVAGLAGLLLAGVLGFIVVMAGSFLGYRKR